MSAVLERPRTAAVRLGFPWLSDKHGRATYDGRGQPVTVAASDLASETSRAIRMIDRARWCLSDARMRACGDLSVSEPIRIALLALEEALQAATARRTALEGMQ